MPEKNRQILLRRRPKGWVTPECFELVETELPTPGAGEALVRVHFMSVDPYMRGMMDDAKSYAEPAKLNAVMPGEIVGEVIGSNDTSLRPGQFVLGDLGWQTHGVARAKDLIPIDPAKAPITMWLGPLGMIGATAVAAKHEIVLAIIGGLFVLEAASVIIQVASFKMTGRRVFRMAPIHHHFEKQGWTESQVVIRFWIIAVMLALAGLSTLKLR